MANDPTKLKMEELRKKYAAWAAEAETEPLPGEDMTSVNIPIRIPLFRPKQQSESNPNTEAKRKP